MANYLVTDTQLTSVANAIRTKGGTNSGLAFPNGFVSAVGNIQGDVWDGLGANSEFVQTIWSENITLADTNFENITVSTSPQIIRDKTRIINTSDNTNIILNWDYDYILIGESKIDCKYSTDIYPSLITTYTIVIQPITTYNVNLNSISSNLQDQVGTETINTTSLSLYKNSNNIIQLGFSSYGLGIDTSTPSININNGIYNLSTPTIRAAISPNALPQEAYDVIDKNNTTFSFILKLYRYKKHSNVRAWKQINLENRFLADYPQYAPQS